jgi:uncharacterized protein
MTTIVMPGQDQLAALCKRWKIRELSLFGSVARGDDRPDSDVDLLVDFTSDAPTTIEHYLDTKDDFERLFGRPVDLIRKGSITNPYRQATIRRDRRLLYAG